MTLPRWPYILTLYTSHSKQIIQFDGLFGKLQTTSPERPQHAINNHLYTWVLDGPTLRRGTLMWKLSSSFFPLNAGSSCGSTPRIQSAHVSRTDTIILEKESKHYDTNYKHYILDRNAYYVHHHHHHIKFFTATSPSL